MKILKLHLKLLFRNKAFWIFFPIMAYLAYGAVYDSIYNLALSGYLTQVLLFYGLMFGYFNRIKIRKETGEYVSILPFYNRSIIFSVIAEYIFSTIILIMVSGIIIIQGVYLGSEIWILREAVIYNFIYFWLPCYTSILCGHILGNGGEKKINVVIIILLALLVGPVLRHFWYSLMALTIGETIADKVIRFISIGQTNIGTSADIFYGFQIEKFRVFHIGVIVSVLILIDLCLRKRINIRRGILLLMSIILCFLGYVRSGIGVNNSLTSEEISTRSNAELAYYSNVDAVCKKTDLRIERITGDVFVCDKLRFDGKIIIQVLKDCSNADLVLYHNLKVKEIKGENIKDYSQNKDELTIVFDRVLKAEEKIELNIKYEGDTSPYFFANEKGCFLPEYYAWLPYSGKGTCFEWDGYNLQPRFLDRKDTKCDIRVNSKYPFFHNNGTLISMSHLNVYSEGEVTVVSPVALNKKVLKENCAEIQKVSKGAIKKIILVPTVVDEMSNLSRVCGDMFYSDYMFWVKDCEMKEYLAEEYRRCCTCSEVEHDKSE